MLFDRGASSYLPEFPFFFARMCPSLDQRSVFAQSRDAFLYLFLGLFIIEYNHLSLFDQVKTVSFDATMTQSSNQNHSMFDCNWYYPLFSERCLHGRDRWVFCQSDRMFFVLFQSLLIIGSMISRCSVWSDLHLLIQVVSFPNWKVSSLSIRLNLSPYIQGSSHRSTQRKSLLHWTKSVSFCSRISQSFSSK